MVLNQSCALFQLASSLATLLSQLGDAGVELRKSIQPGPLLKVDILPPAGEEVPNTPDEELAPDEV